jgi:CheY-like chemotaxis protein
MRALESEAVARVLVVDDDPDILRLVEFRLRKGGHQVRACAGGEEALQLVQERGAPDVAVLDVSMPGMDGFELQRRLRAIDGVKELPVIFLSAKVLPEDVERGRATGATYLTKPFSAVALLAAIERSVRTPDDAW